MSIALLSRNVDLKHLVDEGYFMQIRGGLLVMQQVPYVDENRQVRFGSLSCPLTLAGDRTQRPDTHVMHFDGAFPCNADGSRIDKISHQSGDFDLGHGVKAKHSFSSKPEVGYYTDFYEKMVTYATILSGPAAVLQPGVTPRIYKSPEPEEETVFNYLETASDRVGLGALTDLFTSEVVAFIGLGGSGAYALDLVAKTPVREIRLFDRDDFLTHNAFRAPGAPSLDELREAPKKVDYLKAIYSRMHRIIVAHPVAITDETAGLLDGITFAFVSVDDGPAKALIVKKLEALSVSFVDVGMGLDLDDAKLGGILRTTLSTPSKRDHVHGGRISFAGGAEQDLYATNIQVADLNALNGTLAVIKWKKLLSFYRDLEREHHSTYTIDGNMLLNGDQT